MATGSLESEIQAERTRILAEIARRNREIPRDRDARWQPSQQWLINERRYFAVELLKRCDVFPTQDTRCLEIGFGFGGWLPDLISWGVNETNLHGIDLSERCVLSTRRLLPAADLRVGDAANLPWDESTFDLVIASTVFTSILNNAVRVQVAKEMTRVLAPGGALLWYDFRYDNPKNPNVRKVTRSELRSLFPTLVGEVRTVSLAPPLLRAILPVSRTLTSILTAIPFLRTHLIAVLRKPSQEKRPWK
jgi:SAM-dependent methyltransferase